MSPKKSITPQKRKRYSSKKISAFAINFQKRRLELGLSQLSLGETLGVAPSRISEMEAGRFPTDPERIVAIADALSVDLNWLFGREWPKEYIA